MIEAATAYFMNGCPSWKNVGKVMGGGFNTQVVGKRDAKTMQYPKEDVTRRAETGKDFGDLPTLGALPRRREGKLGRNWGRFMQSTDNVPEYRFLWKFIRSPKTHDMLLEASSIF